MNKYCDGLDSTGYQTTRAPQEDMMGVGVTQDMALDRKYKAEPSRRLVSHERLLLKPC